MSSWIHGHDKLEPIIVRRIALSYINNLGNTLTLADPSVEEKLLEEKDSINISS
ncbi:MAG: hypothetical protein ACL7BU_13045 [Candidatus Phlomobacter fragariae]